LSTGKVGLHTDPDLLRNQQVGVFVDLLEDSHQRAFGNVLDEILNGLFPLLVTDVWRHPLSLSG